MDYMIPDKLALQPQARAKAQMVPQVDTAPVTPESDNSSADCMSSDGDGVFFAASCNLLSADKGKAVSEVLMVEDMKTPATKHVSGDESNNMLQGVDCERFSSSGILSFEDFQALKLRTKQSSVNAGYCIGRIQDKITKLFDVQQAVADSNVKNNLHSCIQYFKALKQQYSKFAQRDTELPMQSTQKLALKDTGLPVRGLPAAKPQPQTPILVPATQMKRISGRGKKNSNWGNNTSSGFRGLGQQLSGKNGALQTKRMAHVKNIGVSPEK
jgi:hypothetical protein